jgi:hypothetical protein
VDYEEQLSVSKKKSISTLIIIIALASITMLIRSHFRAEPSYDGKSLSEWIELYEEAHTPGSSAFANGYEMATQSESAVKTIGSNAVPTLLKWVQMRKAPAREFLNNCLGIHRDAADYHRMASLGFDLLGGQSRIAAPALAQIAMTDSDATARECALRCLMRINADSETVFPVLIMHLQNSNYAIRKEVKSYISQFYPTNDAIFDIDTNQIRSVLHSN